MASRMEVPAPSRSTELARLELTQLPPDVPLDQAFGRACELSADALEVERVGVWLFVDDRSALRCAHLYERSKGEHSFGAILRVADFPTYFASLAIRKAIPAEVAADEPWSAELDAQYLRPLGIRSMLDAGIFVDGTLVGVVCHEHVGSSREWTTEARDFAGSVADLLANRIQAAEVRELRAAFRSKKEHGATHAQSALGHFAAGIAHDFRNLLSIFLSHGELLSRNAALPADARAQGGEITDAAKRGVALVDDLLSYAKPKNAPPAVIDLAEVVIGILPTLRSAAGNRHALDFQRPVALGKVFIDATQVDRVLLNLVVNARDAMPEGGDIQIRLAPIRLRENNCHSGRFVLLEVADTGVGIEEAARRKIFDPFFTTKPNGTGLGLAIVRQIVDNAGGFIRVESQPGHGTTFRIFFPNIGASTGATSDFTIPPEIRQ